ncbi:MAG: sugar phosphate nucleotidyltransferase [Pseudomonadota bacterium]
MKILPVIMSGGAGSRLWPMSRQSIAKQFLPLAGERTMIQDTAARTTADGFLPPAFLCNASHVDLIKEQISDYSAIIVEPEGRNTGPCAMVAALHALDYGPDTLLLLAAADHVIEKPDVFREAIRTAADVAQSGRHVTFGMKPDHPATGFGYIQQGDEIADGIYEIESFREKPDEATAKDYLDSGAYHWNSGIFLFNPATVIEDMLNLSPDCAEPAKQSYERATKVDKQIDLDPATFAQCKSEPVDIALMERTSHGAVLPCEIGWTDIGSFSAYRDLHAKGDETVIFGDGIAHRSLGGLIDTDGPLVTLVGLDNVGVIVREGRVLVVNLEASQDVKQIVTQLKLENRTDKL